MTSYFSNASHLFKFKQKIKTVSNHVVYDNDNDPDSYKKLVNSYRDFDSYYTKRFQRKVSRSEHLSSNFRPIILK